MVAILILDMFYTAFVEYQDGLVLTGYLSVSFQQTTCPYCQSTNRIYQYHVIVVFQAQPSEYVHSVRYKPYQICTVGM